MQAHAARTHAHGFISTRMHPHRRARTHTQAVNTQVLNYISVVKIVKKRNKWKVLYL
jgi:hypothetical protein